MIYGEAFNSLFNATERIEQHIGLRYYTDNETINGRLNNLELSPNAGVSPYCEVDVLIEGNDFTVLNMPILIGDAWVVNNSVFITVEHGNSEKKVVHEWGDVEFIGNTGTLMGAEDAYDGMVLTVTYFYNQTMLYYDIIFNNGYPETSKAGISLLNLVINDISLELNQRIFIDSKGRVSSYLTSDETVGNELYEDSITGDIYELYADNGNINWRLV